MAVWYIAKQFLGCAPATRQRGFPLHVSQYMKVLFFSLLIFPGNYTLDLFCRDVRIKYASCNARSNYKIKKESTMNNNSLVNSSYIIHHNPVTYSLPHRLSGELFD